MISRNRRRNESGQTMAEYAVVLTVITVVVITALELFAGNVATGITKVANLIKF